jgi:hypothetical protein
MANKYWGDFSVKIENDGRDKLELLKQAIEKGLNSPTIEDFNFDKTPCRIQEKVAE